MSKRGRRGEHLAGTFRDRDASVGRFIYHNVGSRVDDSDFQESTRRGESVENGI